MAKKAKSKSKPAKVKPAKAAAAKKGKSKKVLTGIEKKVLSEAVTGRFMEVMAEIIAQHRRKNGPYQSVNDFAKSVSGNAAYMSQYRAPIQRNVTLEMCCMLCKVHGVDANWLLLGTGERYIKHAESRFELINKRISAIEGALRKRK